MISIPLLIAAGINPTAAKIHAAPLAAAAARFDIDTRARVAAFLGQAAHETQGLTAFEESLFYRDAERIAQIFKSARLSIAEAQELTSRPGRNRSRELANRVYANRGGNGNVASGDGWRYRGRGAGHLTFRDNYRAAGSALGRPYEAQPDLVAQPEDAALSFAWYWHTNKCNVMADGWAIDDITRAINPGMAGKNERRVWCNTFADALREQA